MTRKFGKAALIIVLLPVIIPLATIGIAFFVANRLVLNVLVRFCWILNGKDILLVSSDSPIWHEYMTSQILPLVGQRAEVLNWSERKRWSKWSLAVRVFHAYSGGKNFNPMVIMFRPLRPARFFRFHLAFQELKHGKQEPIEQMRADLISHL